MAFDRFRAAILPNYSRTFLVHKCISICKCTLKRIVGGEVRGTIRADEQVLLHASAKVYADIHTPALVMEDGAFLEGSVAMDSQDVKKNTNKSPSTS